jgi:glycosyltransferase involved in cell wall biosynthesis
MKIVTIWSTYGPYHLARVKALKKAFPHAKIDCLAHCSSSDDYIFFNKKSRNIHILNDRKSSELNFCISFFSTVKYLYTNKPQLILTCGYERPETLASLIWSKINKSQIFLMLDNNYGDKSRSLYVEFIKSIYLKFFDGFIYGGNPDENYLLKLGLPLERIVNGYNCVDNDYIGLMVARTKKKYFPIIKGNYFLCVSRLVPKKNLMRLVEAYQIYVKENSRPWSLVICGDGPERYMLERYLEKEKLSNLVIIVGAVNEFYKLINYYTYAKYLILASHENEQWGLAVNEAMASGLPVLVSKYCGCASSLVVNNENGLIFDGRLIPDIAQKIIWMHENSKSLTKMGLKSKKIIKEFSTKNFASEVKNLFLLAR